MTKQEINEYKLRHRSLGRQRAKLQKQLKETREKDVEIGHMLTNAEIDMRLELKLKIFEDGMDSLIESHESFDGINPEELIGTDKAQYEYINGMIIELGNVIRDGETSIQVFRILRKRYALRIAALLDNISNFTETMNKITRETMTQEIEKEGLCVDCDLLVRDGESWVCDNKYLCQFQESFKVLRKVSEGNYDEETIS